jgi:hypothetical protein
MGKLLMSFNRPSAKSCLLAFALAFGSSTHCYADEGFTACPQFFAKGTPPAVENHPMQRALCYDAFAILHSDESKTQCSSLKGSIGHPLPTQVKDECPAPA